MQIEERVKNGLKIGRHEYFDDYGNLEMRKIFEDSKCVKCEIKKDCIGSSSGNSVSTEYYGREVAARGRKNSHPWGKLGAPQVRTYPKMTTLYRMLT